MGGVETECFLSYVQQNDIKKAKATKAQTLAAFEDILWTPFIRVEEKTNANADLFDREGYTLTGWNTKADGSGESFEVDEPVENIVKTTGTSFTL